MITNGMNKKKKHAHFIGLCGVGMSAVAKLLSDQGWTISGSDEAVYPPISEYLKEHNLSCATGYSKDNIPENTQLIVIGKNAKLVPETNEEVREALSSGIEVLSFPEVIARIAQDTENIICAGSHGKSTCSALMSWCLVHSGKDPSYFIGAIPKNFDVSSQLGKGNIFVLEGDEYPSSNKDMTSKFLYYKPHDVLLTSVEHDHVNIFPTQEEFAKPFAELLKLIPSDGVLVVHGHDVYAQKLLDKYKGVYVTYSGTNDTDWGASDIEYGEATSFNLTHEQETVVRLTTSALGFHNVENIVGVSAMLLEKGLVTTEELISAIERFEGITRRLDKKTKTSAVPVYEGFGSSYTKADAAIKAIRTHFPDKRMVVVFEPHTFSWRNKDYIHHYDTIFSGIEKAFIYKPATQGSTTHKQLTADDIVSRVKNSGVDTTYIPDEKTGLELVDENVANGDVVLLLTSGNLDGMVQSIPNLLDNKFGIENPKI